MKPAKNWILIANSKTARIVENDGPGKGLFQPSGLARQALKENAYEDQPGRSFNSATGARSKMEAHQRTNTPRDGFAAQLVSDLVGHHNDGQFDRLIICATPAMLSQVRKLLPKQLQSLLIAEVPKDLTHIPTEKLSSHFENFLAI